MQKIRKILGASVIISSILLFLETPTFSDVFRAYNIEQWLEMGYVYLKLTSLWRAPIEIKFEQQWVSYHSIPDLLSYI